MSLPETAQDANAMRRLGREYSDLENVVELWRSYETASKDLEQAQALLSEETDEEMLDMARAEIADAESRIEPLIEQIQSALSSKRPTPTCTKGAKITIQAGADQSRPATKATYKPPDPTNNPAFSARTLEASTLRAFFKTGLLETTVGRRGPT